MPLASSARVCEKQNYRAKAEGGEEALVLEWLLDLGDGNIWWWLFVWICLPFGIVTVGGAVVYLTVVTVRRRRGL